MKHQQTYERIYAAPHLYRSYGSTNHGRHDYDTVLAMRPSSIVDLGCGDNAFLRHPALADIPTTGVDFAHPMADIRASLTRLPFTDKQIDLAVSFDCLEHLDPVEVSPALAEICRISRRFLFRICYRDSKVRAPDGSTLHPTVQPEEWWIKQIEFHGGTCASNNGHLKGEWK